MMISVSMWLKEQRRRELSKGREGGAHSGVEMNELSFLRPIPSRARCVSYVS